MKVVLRILLFWILIVYANVVQAQQKPKPFLLSWSEKDGLSDNAIYSVAKDHKGYLWVTSADGLNRFDGKSFEVFRYDPKDSTSLGSNIGRDILIARDSTIWVATHGGGLSVFDYKKNHFQRLQPDDQFSEKGLSDNRLNCFLETDEGNVLIGYAAISSGRGGLTVLSPELQVRKHIMRDKEDVNGFAVKVTNITSEDQAPVYWFGSRGLHRWDSETDKVQSFNHEGFVLDYSNLSGLLNYSDSVLLVSFYNDGLWVFDKKNQRFKEHLIQHPVQTMIKRNAEEIWVADRIGIGRLDVVSGVVDYEMRMNGEESPFPEKTRVINLFYIDDNLWICTNNGLFCWNEIFQQFNLQGMERPDGSLTFYSDYLGAIGANEWVFLDRRKGIVITDSLLKIKRTLSLPENVPTLKGRVVLHPEEPFVAISGRRNLFRWNLSEDVIRRWVPKSESLDLTKVQIWSFYARKNKLFMGTRYDGLLVLDLETDSLRQYLHDPENPLSLCHDRYLFEIDEDKTGNLWICTDKGLSIFDPELETFLLYSNLEPVQNHIIHAVEPDQFGDVFIGTRNQGLFKYEFDKQQLTNYTTGDGLLYNGVNQLQLDDSILWATSSKGINIIDPKHVSISGFDEKKGAPVNSLYGSRMARLPDKRIYISLRNSYYHARFSKADLKEDYDPPEVNITGFKVLNHQGEQFGIIENGTTVSLAANQNYFSIDYNGIHFQQADQIQYEYHLEAYQDNWIQAGSNTTAFFTNIPGGAYQFKIRAANGDGQWSETQSLTILLATPWYETSWFYLLLVLIVAGLAYAIWKYRLRQVRREEQFKQQLAETEMKALRSQINPHFIFNCLNSIKGYIIENRIEDGTEYVGRFAQLIRMILNHSKERLIPISKEIEAIKLYVWLEQERLNHKFDVEYDLKFKSDPEELKISPLLFQPYVENSIWHGLMNLKEKGKLQIIIEEQTDQLVIQIKDNGVGRKAAQEIKKKSVFSKQSMGLDIAASRLQQINSLYKLESTVTIEDLYADREHTGTVVAILFPLIKKPSYAESNNS